MLTSVKIDMSQEAVDASIENSPMRFVMMVGTLYWIIATEMPDTSITIPTQN